MKPRFECLRCVLTVRLKEIESTSAPFQVKLEVAKRLVELLTNTFSPSVELTHLATSTFKLVISSLPEVAEYYKRVKSESTIMALKDITRHEEYISKFKDSYERFKYLVKLSGLANLIDYGVAEHTVTVKSIDPVLVESSELYIDHTRKFYEKIERGGLQIIWLFDNAGEAVYDSLLIREIKSRGNSVIGLVKEEPGFQNDLTVQDAVSSGLTKILDRVLAYSGSTIHVENLSSEVLASLKKADLIIAKGMSHYEYLSENPLGVDVVFIFIPKCAPVASTLNISSTGKIICLYRSGEP